MESVNNILQELTADYQLITHRCAPRKKNIYVRTMNLRRRQCLARSSGRLSSSSALWAMIAPLIFGLPFGLRLKRIYVIFWQGAYRYVISCKRHVNARSSSTSTSCLPEAVLIMIFKFAVFRGHISICMMAYYARPDVDFKTLISLTHVCREWRYIALGYPGLWTRLDVHHNTDLRFATLVKRAKSMPLDFNIVVTEDEFHSAGRRH